MSEIDKVVEETIAPALETNREGIQATLQVVTELNGRVGALEQASASQRAINEQQQAIIESLQNQKASAESQARASNRIAKVLVLSLVLTPFVVDAKIEDNKFSIATKEVPLFIGALYGGGVLVTLLDDYQIKALASLFTIWKTK